MLAASCGCAVFWCVVLVLLVVLRRLALEVVAARLLEADLRCLVLVSLPLCLWVRALLLWLSEVVLDR